ncbi:porin [Pelomonas sp. SE-A7]|uniref:porin n=1 Tax=Pelomonas sp. SE-A7 TaxID=3054953 RepID=UPI00259D0884|nr:porin [Pelomonas sp. SE-A7]MDM4767738.1 porin [Pelomonas sp. SE-A7]
MKKSILLGAVLASLAGAAAAQSTVTAFGVVDLAMRQAKSSGKTLNLLATDGNSSSRLGFRGTEDLGDGLKANFWIEAALAADVGTQGSDTARFWSRRATVSLSDSKLGEIRLGRHKTAARLVIDGFTPFETAGIADISKVYSLLGSAADTLNRADNQVAYNLPDNLGGLYGTLEVGAGEGTDGKKYKSARLGYKDGALNIAGGLADTDAKASSYKLNVIGASYNFGPATVQATVGNTKFNAAKQSIYTVGVIVPVVGDSSFRAHYASSNANAAAEALSGVGDIKLLTLGYVHAVSKRTALYMTVAEIKNSGKSAVAIAGSPTVTAGQKSSAFDVGLRHSY